MYVRIHIHHDVHTVLEVDRGTLKMRDMKQRERKQRHQNSGVETARNVNNGTILQGGGKCET